MEPPADLCKLLIWFQRFGLLSPLYLPEKTLSMCGQDKLCWDEVQMNASVVVFGQFSKAVEENLQSRLNIGTPKPPRVSRS